MAEYEPFPTGANEVETNRRLGARLAGCFGLGGLSVGAFLLLAILAAGMIGSLGSCDIDLGGPAEPRGSRSARLPVTVAPATGLRDGSVVRVTSDAFDEDEIVAVAMCLPSADTERRGEDACDLTHIARYATDGRGHLDATFAVPRAITVGARAYDCAERPKRCLLVVADVVDFDRSGGRAVSFEAGLPPVDLTTDHHRETSDHLPIGAQPSVEAPVAPGTELTVLASGFQPDEPLLVAYCTSTLEEDGVVESCEPLDARDAVAAIALSGVHGDFLRADGAGAFTTRLEARAAVTPFGDDVSKAMDALDTTTTSTEPDPDAVACTAGTGGCSIVIAAAADTTRSAVLPYVVTG